VHLHDVCALFVHALDDARARGPLNAVAPGIVRNRTFAATLGRVLRRPALLPAPPFALRLLLGEIGSVLTASQRVVPARPQALGFSFRFPVLEPALRDLLAPR
jgi:NAD dependent epimerase/dehydratase family enzyme